MQATQASDHSPSQPASGVDLASQGSIPQNINQPSMVSPVIYCSQMSMPKTATTVTGVSVSITISSSMYARFNRAGPCESSTPG